MPVYDVSQTDGEPQSSVDADAEGEPGPLLPALQAAAEDTKALDASYRRISEI